MMKQSVEEKELLDVEFFVLGQAVNYYEHARTIVQRLSEHHFLSDKHRNIFVLIRDILNHRDTISIALLWEEIKKRNLDKHMDVSYLIHMSQNADIPIDLDQHIDFLHEQYINCLLKEFLDSAFQDFTRYPNRRSPYTLVEQFKERLDTIHTKTENSRKKCGRTIYEIFSVGNNGSNSVISQIRNRYDYRSKYHVDYVDGLLTGYASIDEHSIILSQGNFIVLAARPAMGKTAFAIDMALNLVLDQKKSVGFISLEMSPNQIVERIISNLSEVSCEQLKRGNFSRDILAKIEQLDTRLKNIPFFICDNKCTNLHSLINQSRALKNDYAIDALFIDYLQLISPPKKSENRQNEIAEISRELRKLAVELQIPIICLSQLSRKVEDRVDKRPMLSDLRDSGQIEQDADVILFIHRKDSSSQEGSKGVAEIIVGKNRHGSVFSTNLKFSASIGKFSIQKESW
ncbi:replicative DNA helicase [Chlamydia avium]|nr:DnaB-like helicase C-terminal domain-containing protein [Chlamydia avium]EPP36077.1 dnaB-like helicase N terminal domain protein [Chlamydia psittaci 10_743_SC13]EPP37945.1 dnaB-like helicase N terminal domain protein [Chlamydia avium]